MARRAAELDADIDRREQRKAQQEAEQRKAHQRQKDETLKPEQRRQVEQRQKRRGRERELVQSPSSKAEALVSSKEELLPGISELFSNTLRKIRILQNHMAKMVPLPNLDTC